MLGSVYTPQLLKHHKVTLEVGSVKHWKKKLVFDEDLKVMNILLPSSSARVEESFILPVLLG